MDRPPTRHALLRDRRHWDGVTLQDLAAAPDGALALAPDATAGTLLAGPLDAGVLSDWERVTVDAEPAGGVTLELHAAADTASAPNAGDWRRMPSRDALVPPPGDARPPGARRYLWLRVGLTSRAGGTSPRLHQVHAESARDSYLDHLPAVYRRRDEDGFLERWLALFRSALGDMEYEFDAMPRRFDPATAPDDHLDWLAGWLGFPLPAGLDADGVRALLARVPELYRRRGTPEGVADLVELYAGVRPRLVEAFHHRRLWQLGTTSRLGFDTALAPAPDGMVVPGRTPADPAYLGLRGEYYGGTSFDRLLRTQVDPTVDFAAPAWPAAPVPNGFYSVRWTGQVQPRHSETYTFHVRSHDGARLWVNGLPIIDDWASPPAAEASGRVAMRGGEWHALRLEYHERGVGGGIQLAWSSASQRREVVPQSRLYAVLDDAARLDDEGLGDGDGCELLVGQAVVGESGPQTPSQFGAPLFAETAHLFTAIVPVSGRVLSRAQRDALRRALDAEKPAHTDYHLCFVRPRMRVGFQARLGIDSIVAGPPDPLQLDGAVLGLDSYLGAGAAGDHDAPPRTRA